MRGIFSCAVVALLFSFAAPVEAQQWGTLQSWRGDGGRDTESFTVDAREWRVRWSIRGDTDASAFYVRVNRSSDGRTVGRGTQNSPGSGETYVRSEPGRFYLSISSANVEWDVRVEVPGGSSGAPATPRPIYSNASASVNSGPIRVVAGMQCSAGGGCNPEFVQLVFLSPVGEQVLGSGRLVLPSGDSHPLEHVTGSVKAGAQEMAWANVPVEFFESFVRLGGSGYTVAGVDAALDTEARRELQGLLSRLP